MVTCKQNLTSVDRYEKVADFVVDFCTTHDRFLSADFTDRMPSALQNRIMIVGRKLVESYLLSSWGTYPACGGGGG